MRKTRFLGFLCMCAAAWGGAGCHDDDGGPVGPVPVGVPQDATTVARTFAFSAEPGLEVPVLEARAFDDGPGLDGTLPRTHEAIVAAARAHWLGPVVAGGSGAGPEPCGETSWGQVLRALQNPRVEDRTRRAVDAVLQSATPPLGKSVTAGKFRLFYTDSDPNPDHNVTLAQVKAAATVLNQAWDAYVPLFGAPQHVVAGGKPQVDVRVYYLSATRYGSTSSFGNTIYLNSRKVLRDPCKLYTTPAHELFHRVQYAHGYTSGQKAISWAVEGTAAWSQKLRAPHIGDWIARADYGLDRPYRKIDERSYDAVHLWLHLGRLASGGEVAVMQELWKAYARVVGHTREPMFGALNATIEKLVGRGKDHEWLVASWSEANYLKELKGASFSQTYDEQTLQLRCDLSKYGPLNAVRRKVTRTYPNACGGSAESFTYTTQWYASRYFLLDLKPGAPALKVTLSAPVADYAFSAVESGAGGQLLRVIRSGMHKKSMTYDSATSPNLGKVERLVFIAAATGKGDKVTVTIEPAGQDTCAALGDACNAGTCSGGACVKVPRPDNTVCDDGNPATPLTTCQKGACVPVP